MLAYGPGRHLPRTDLPLPVGEAWQAMFKPVLDFIADHGLSLVYTETDAEPEWIHGQRIREIYA